LTSVDLPTFGKPTTATTPASSSAIALGRLPGADEPFDPVHDRVDVEAPADWFVDRLGFDPQGGVAPIDWLATPQQLLLEVTAGAVFHDGLGALEPIRRSLSWYPDEIWRWLVGCQWTRIGQEEPFVGRTAEVGDELGSRLVAGRLVRDLIRLCFLLERRYAPYGKWLGSAFGRLEAASDVGPPLARAVGASDLATRERALVEAYEAVAARADGAGAHPCGRRPHGQWLALTA